MLTILKKNKGKLNEVDDDDNYVIQPSNQHIDLIDTIKLILDFNETIQLDLVWKHKTKNKNKMNTYCAKCKKDTENFDKK